MRYDVTAHPLLSDEAKALSSSDAVAFIDQNELAEIMLELDTDPVYTDVVDGPQLETKITRAVALQLNYQIELGVEGFATASADPSEIRRYFRQVRGEQPVLHPQATIIRDQVRAQYEELTEPDTAGLWTTVRSVR